VDTGYNFTDRVRRSLRAAREAADDLHHEHIGTEHVLLGLLRVPDSTAARILTALSVSPSDLASAVTGQLEPGSAERLPGPDLPYTARAKKALTEAMTEARHLRHGYVGTEHVLLGLFREKRGIAAQALARMGLSIEQVRAETLRFLEASDDQKHLDAPATPEPYSSARLAVLLSVIALVVAITALALSLR
jgi:ATP-dependent Clp protease ATP-binding subunit ClpC